MTEDGKHLVVLALDMLTDIKARLTVLEQADVALDETPSPKPTGRRAKGNVVSLDDYRPA